MSDNQPSAEIEVVISNIQGLHARPAMRFVDVASRFGSAIRVRNADREVDGKSPMEMMLLEAIQGTTLQILANGEDAAQAVRDLADLVNNKFGED